jgi:hypothetical protein
MKCTRLPVPNCSDNQGRSHAREAAKNGGKKSDSNNFILKEKTIALYTDCS